MPSPTDAQPFRLAYLNSHYPALSHTFIEREIDAVRAEGIEVETFSIRASPPADLRSQKMQDEAARTFVLLGGEAAPWVQAHGGLLRAKPGASLGTALAALREGDRTAKAKLWQTFYFGEAVVLHDRMRAMGLRHVHVHHANVSADVARLACRIGNHLDGPDTWTWSLTVHGSAEFENIQQWDIPAKLRQTRAIACISDYCRGQLMRLVDRSHWDKMQIVRMSVDPEQYQPPVQGRHHDGPLRLLAVGRLVLLKGFDVLVDACASLRDRGVAVEVRIVGQGPEQTALQAHIDEAGMGDQIQLVGPVGQDHIVEQYHWADAYLMSSFMEGLPVVVMEAMATGLPVVATEVAAMSELVVDGHNGLLVRMGRPDLLGDAIARLAADRQEREQMGKAGRESVLAEFTPRQTGPAMADFLRSVLSTRRPPA